MPRRKPVETYAEARARRERAGATLAELELARRRGELLPAGQVIGAWQAAIGRARSLLLSLPPAAAGEIMLVASRGEGAVRERLADLVHAALAELADAPLDDLGEEADEEGSGGPADGRTA